MSQTNEIDLLAPFEIWEVMLDNSTIKFHQPLLLTPQRMPHDSDEPGHVTYLEVDVQNLNISAWGKDRDELWENICDNIAFNWRTYVTEDDANLSSLAQSFKRSYLSVAEVVDG